MMMTMSFCQEEVDELIPADSYLFPEVSGAVALVVVPAAVADSAALVAAEVSAVAVLLEDGNDDNI